MTIICGTDFSEHSGQAARAAAALAQCLGEPLRLVHVLSNPGNASLPALGMFYEPVEELLASQAEKLASEFSIAASPLVLEGPADLRLATLANDLQARLIVVSSLGARKAEHWLVGSVAQGVMQRSEVPVLVVREAASIEEWARGERALQILIGVDLGQSSRAALRWAEALRDIRPCDVCVAQVAWPIGEHARFGLEGPIPLDHLTPELQAFLERDLRTWVGELRGAGKTTLRISACWGRVDTQLTLLARENQADLLVLGNHRRPWTSRMWHGSVSYGVVHQTQANVACVPCSPELGERSEITRYRSVLIPTDFSTLANRALPAGYGLLSEGGEAHLLHVVTSDQGDAPPDLSAHLRALVPATAEALGITTHVHVLEESEAWSGIWHTASRLAVDVICMAAHGRTGAARAFVGSQAEEVLKHAHQPVLLVKSGARR
ncbi:MAG: universal stress protein [Polyangiaceae bacterium]